MSAVRSAPMGLHRHRPVEEERSDPMRKVLVLGASALLIAAACSSGTDSGSQGYKIGYDSSQTGILAYSDVPASKGVQMAIDEINAKGGIDGKWKIDLTLQDNRSEAAQSAVVAQDLISKGVPVPHLHLRRRPVHRGRPDRPEERHPHDVDRGDLADAARRGRRLHVHERLRRQHADDRPRRLCHRQGLQERLPALLARLVVHVEVVRLLRRRLREATAARSPAAARSRSAPPTSAPRSRRSRTSRPRPTSS